MLLFRAVCLLLHGLQNVTVFTLQHNISFNIVNMESISKSSPFYSKWSYFQKGNRMWRIQKITKQFISVRPIDIHLLHLYTEAVWVSSSMIIDDKDKHFILFLTTSEPTFRFVLLWTGARCPSAKKNSMVWVRERTIPTERPLLVGEVIVNFCG
jgi:hypothetical protein